MKGIKQILKDAGLDIAEDKAAEIDKAVAENYATRAELGEKRAKIETLQKQLEELGEKIESADADAAKVEELKKQLDDYKAAEEERQAQSEEQANRAEFEKQLAETIGDKSFANGITKTAVYGKAYELHKANPDMEISAALEAATAGQDDVWANPQTQAAKMPIPGTESTSNQADKVSFANALFGSKK